MTAKLPIIVAAAAAMALALTTVAPASAQPSSSAPPSSAPPSGIAQPGNTVSFREDPNPSASPLFGPLMKAYYELCVAELGKGADKVDVADFEQKSYALFRSVAVSKGVNPDALQQHLKGIPREVVLIVKRDPKTLDSLQSFTDALVGPQDWAAACVKSPECSRQRDAIH
jgi:hypothetical protein